MTIQEMNNILDDMKKVYKFKEDKTRIRMEGACTFDNGVKIATEDEATGVHIEMFKEIERSESRC